MFFVDRRSRKSEPRRGTSQAYFNPSCEPLEAKILLTIDLGGTSPTANPIIASAPFGMDFGAGTIPNLANVARSMLRHQRRGPRRRER